MLIKVTDLCGRCEPYEIDHVDLYDLPGLGEDNADYIVETLNTKHIAYLGEWQYELAR